MKILPIVIIILVLAACSENKASRQDREFDSVQENLTLNVDTNNELHEYEGRTSFDSLNFSIIRRKHKNGKPYIESITDKESKIDLWKDVLPV